MASTHDLVIEVITEGSVFAINEIVMYWLRNDEKYRDGSSQENNIWKTEPKIWTEYTNQLMQKNAETAAIDGQKIRIALEPDVASTKSHIFSVKKTQGAISYRPNANKVKRLVLGDTDYRMQLLITERKTVENLRLKLVPFNLEGDYLVHVMLINLREQMIRWCCLDKEENSVVQEVLQNLGQDLLDHYCLDQHTRCMCIVSFVFEGRPFPVVYYIFSAGISLCDSLGFGCFHSGYFVQDETKIKLWGSAKRDYRLQSLKQRMENVRKKILLYDPLDQDYRLQSLIQMMECVEKLILLLDSLDQDDCYRMRRLIGEMEHVEKQMLFLDLYHQDAYYRMIRMIKGMENVIIPKLWLTPFGQDDLVIHVAKLHPSTTVQNIDEVHKHKEKTDDDYQFLQLKEALDLQLLQYCEKGKMKVIDGRIASETRALWNRFLIVVQIDKLKMKRLRTIYGKDGIKPEQLERPQPNAMRIKRSG